MSFNLRYESNYDRYRQNRTSSVAITTGTSDPSLLVTIAQIFGFSIFAPEYAWILAQQLILLAAVWGIGNKISANRT